MDDFGSATDDLASLSHLDEDVLLQQIKQRYKNNIIYTYIGDILVAVNPYQPLPIYGANISAKYKHSRKGLNPPHIYATADFAYQTIMGQGGSDPGNLCILISGESGAGKTESTKLLIRQLMELCHSNSQLEQQILQVNPVLEAFGNARTLMNDNSSRFGKYIQLKFYKGQVLGAKISEYLLEKSRLVRQSQGEENFHIYYYMFAGKTKQELQQLYLDSTQTYRYLTGGVRNASFSHEEYSDVVNAFDLVGFTDEEQEGVFSILAGVLNLGNVTFTSSNDQTDGVHVDSVELSLHAACKLLGIDSVELAACLTSSRTVTRGDVVTRNYNESQATDARDAMTKALYGRLFGWIVNKINRLVAPQQVLAAHKVYEIGILDIFGFEHFAVNSFEQACINLANEQLQYFFNEYVLKQEQQEYMREGLDWSEITYRDNQPLLDLFLKKPLGILSILDEESHFPQGTDHSLVEKLNKNFSEHPGYVTQAHSASTFAIMHYAGKVVYTATGWLEKNRDTFPSGVLEVLIASNNSLVQLIFNAQITRTGSLALDGRRSKSNSQNRNKKMPDAMSLVADAVLRKMTVGAQFRTSLQVLMERMTSAIPLFIRCLNPNHNKHADEFDDDYIQAQLLYTGMVQTTQIRRDGYAVRPTFREFIERYKYLARAPVLPPTAQSCALILQNVSSEGWKIGKSKVFLKWWQVDRMLEQLGAMQTAATHMQRLVRGFLARRRAAVMWLETQRQSKLMGMLSTLVQRKSGELFDALLRLQEEDRKTSEAKKLAKQKSADKLSQYKLPSYDEVISGDFPDGQVIEDQFVLEKRDTKDEEGDSSSDICEDTFIMETPEKIYGKPGTLKAMRGWFNETQVSHITTGNGQFAPWFHGIIPRREAERLLKGKRIGCFLIRVSETRFGYSLSFRDLERCRHYMIDQLPNSKYLILGEPKVHKSLKDLISYHKTNKISNWDGLLTVPCEQEEGICNFQNLINTGSARPLYHVLETHKKKAVAGATNEQAEYTLLSETVTHPVRAPPTLTTPRRDTYPTFPTPPTPPQRKSKQSVPEKQGTTQDVRAAGKPVPTKRRPLPQIPK